MLEYDPVASLRFFPMPMVQFGLNPYGETLYRVVFSPSRRYLVVGEWPDGSRCARWVEKYHVGNKWVLEKWVSAAEFARCSREHWDQNQAHTLGPWPERGEYELVEVFQGVTPTLGLVEKLISMQKWGREHYSLAEHQAFHRDAALKEAAMQRDVADAMLRDKIPAFGIRAFAGAHGRRRGFDEDADLKSAEELGLPTRRGTRVMNPPAAA